MKLVYLAGHSSYDSVGNLKDITPANSVIGHGLINNMPVAVYGDDFTIEEEQQTRQFGKK